MVLTSDSVCFRKQRDMVELCGKCSEELPDDGNFARCGACLEEYHLTPQCSIAETTWNSKGQKQKKSWRCNKCRSVVVKEDKPQKGEDNTNHQSINTVGESGWTREVAELRALILTGQKKLDAKLESWNENLHKANNEQTQSIKKLEKTIEKLLKLSEEKDNRINNLEKQVLALETKLYENHIEIHGVQESGNKEDCETVQETKRIAEEILKRYDSSLTKQDIIKAHRRSAFNDKYKGKSPIIVQLIPGQDRQELIKKYRKKVNTQGQQDVRIYEFLASAQRTLLWETKERARNQDWKYVWTQAGSILTRRAEGEKVTQIKSHSDLIKIVRA